MNLSAYSYEWLVSNDGNDFLAGFHRKTHTTWLPPDLEQELSRCTWNRRTWLRHTDSRHSAGSYSGIARICFFTGTATQLSADRDGLTSPCSIRFLGIL